jgi:hypothetical protein
MNMKKLLLFALLVLAASAASAQTQTINFECCNGQKNPHIGVANFSGGLATPTVNFLGSGSQGVMYFSRTDMPSPGCSSCSSDIVMTFDKEVSNLSFSLGNGYPLSNATYKIETDNGAAVTQTLVACPYTGSWAKITPPGNNFKRVVIHAPLLSGTFDGKTYTNSFWDFAIDDMAFTVTPVDTRLVFGLVDTEGVDSVIKTLPRTATSAAFPLGGKFFFRVEKLQNGNWNPIPSTASLSNVNVNRTNFDGNTVFPNDPILVYNGGAQQNDKLFQGIHFGSATLTLTTNDPKYHQIPVSVTINTPRQLGKATYVNANGQTVTTNTDFDSYLIQLGHKGGIPPQLLKAQIEQEANFNRHAFRYELRTRDMNMVEVSTHQYWKGNDPYARYRMGDGAQLCPNPPLPGLPPSSCAFSDLNDVSPRSRYHVLGANGTPHNITAQDGVVTIRQIFDADNGTYGWYSVDPAAPPPPRPGRRRAARPPDPMNVPAQTTLASSYGLFQLVYTDIIDRPVRWVGFNGRFNPTLLFDDDANLRRAEGSLFVGALKDRLCYGSANGNIQSPHYNSPGDFESDLRDMFICYNGADTYGQQVLDREDHYLPYPGTAISANSCVGVEGNFISQSSGASLAPGQTTTLGVALPNPDDATYQWYLNSQSNPIPGATDSTLEVSTPGIYWCGVPAPCGPVFSDAIVVTSAAACTPAEITAQPQDVSIAFGASTNLQVGGSGTDVHYAWYAGEPQRAGDIVPTGTIAGETSPRLTVHPTVTTTYTAVVYNSCGYMESRIATVTVSSCTAPAVTSQPQPATIDAGRSAPLSVTASGTTPLTIQWFNQAGIPVGSGSMISVSPSSTTLYSARVSNACGSANSDLVTITINGQPCTPPVVSTQPQAQPSTINAGQTSTLSIGTDAASVQWFTTTGAPAGSGASITVSPATTTSYFARASNACSSVDSNSVTVTVQCNAPVISSQPQALPSTIDAGQTSTLSVSTNATTVQWFTTTGAPVGSGASITVSPSATTSYLARASNSCGSIDSNSVTVTVNPPACNPPVISTQAQAQPSTITSGETSTLSIGTNTTSVQWLTTTGAPAGNGASVVVSPAGTTSYFARVSNSCGSIDSNSVTVTVNAPACNPPVISSQPRDVTFSAGDPVTFSIDATGAGLTYQWYESPLGSPYAPVAGATGTSLSITPAGSVSVFCRVTASCGQSTDSQVATATPCAPTFVQQPKSAKSTDPGHQTIFLAVSVQSDSPASYQWYESTNFGPFTPIAGATDQFINVTPSQTTIYYCTATNACGTAQSNYAIITVCYSPVISQQPASQTVIRGSSVTLTVAASSPAGDSLRYQWYYGIFDPQAIQGETGPSLTFDVQFSGEYSVRVTNDCTDIFSDTASITVVDPAP